MDLSKIKRNDWIVVAGFVVLFIGTVAPWYGVSVKLMGQTVASASVNGWHGSYLGWLDFFLCLAAAICRGAQGGHRPELRASGDRARW